ncbi:hypothetical protein M758_1G163400 [Ceratodon purpureus]|nr:hypothetical protein M758_1G163400 [Ceratodon purpureus]
MFDLSGLLLCLRCLMTVGGSALNFDKQRVSFG